MSEQSISEQRNKTPIRACRSKGGADQRGGTAAVTNQSKISTAAGNGRVENNEFSYVGKGCVFRGGRKKIKPASIVLMCADTHTLGKKRHSSRLRAAGQSRCRRACLELFVWLARLTSHQGEPRWEVSRGLMKTEGGGGRGGESG